VKVTLGRLGIDFAYIAWQFDHGGCFVTLCIAASIIFTVKQP
jgi:hypothetical protein